MSLAWATIALLLLLLPGFLFFVGLYVPEKFTRDLAPRSPLGQLAGSVALAFLIHGLLFLLIQAFCGWRWNPLPCVNLEYVFAAFQLELPHDISAADLAQNLQQHRVGIFLYFSLTSVAGLGLGYLAGTSAVEGGWGSFLAQHRWVNALALEDDGPAYMFAYVLTHVSHEDRVLMYRGALRQFALKRDGTFAYLVLSGPRRTYLRLGERASGVDERFHVIGSSSPVPTTDMLMVIEGEDVANVVFRRRPYVASPKRERAVQEAIEDLVQQVWKTPWPTMDQGLGEGEEGQ